MCVCDVCMKCVYILIVWVLCVCVYHVCGVCMMCVYTSIAVILAWTPERGRQNRTGPGAGRQNMSGSFCFVCFCLSYTLLLRPGPKELCPHLKVSEYEFWGGDLHL